MRGRRLAVFSMIGMLWSTFISPVKADERVFTAAFYSGLAAADLASTEYALNHGARERNPLMQGRGTRYALKLAQVGALTWLDHEAGKRDKKLQKVIRAIAVGVAVYAVQNNVRQGR